MAYLQDHPFISCMGTIFILVLLRYSIECAQHPNIYRQFIIGFNLLINNQWKHVDYLDCDGKNNTSHWLNNTATPQPIFTTGKPKLADRFSSMCFKNGQQVIEFLDLGQKNQYADFAALIILLLLLRAFAFLALFLRAKYSR